MTGQAEILVSCSSPRFLLVVLDARCIEGWRELGKSGGYGSRREGACGGERGSQLKAVVENQAK